MRLYLVKATDDEAVPYDVHAGAVIAARNELHALELFGQHCTTDETVDYAVTPLARPTEPGVILSDFRAG